MLKDFRCDHIFIFKTSGCIFSSMSMDSSVKRTSQKSSSFLYSMKAKMPVMLSGLITHVWLIPLHVRIAPPVSACMMTIRTATQWSSGAGLVASLGFLTETQTDSTIPITRLRLLSFPGSKATTMSPLLGFVFIQTFHYPLGIDAALSKIRKTITHDHGNSRQYSHILFLDLLSIYIYITQIHPISDYTTIANQKNIKNHLHTSIKSKKNKNI